MIFQEFQEIFEEECEKNKIVFVKESMEKFYEYMNLILEWNQKVNVTAVREEIAFIVKHLIDSLTVSEFLKDTHRILDIGTGAGLPGIPLKLYHPEKDFVLIDSISKKVMVLKDVISKMELDRIEALQIRAEDLAQDLAYREQFDVVTTRAVSGLSTIVEYMLPFVKVGGKAICMKGPQVEQEIKEAQKAIAVLGGEIEEIRNFRIDDEFERNLVVIKKIKNTEKKYPRGQGKPLKSPIGL